MTATQAGNAAADPLHALASLPARVPTMAAACRVHRHAAAIDAALLDWLHSQRLADESTRQRTALCGFGGFASRALPESKLADALLTAQWFAWLFVFDDELDEGPLARDPAALDGYCARLPTALRQGRPGAGAGPVEIALIDLWTRTAGRVSPAWTERFLANLQLHREASRGQAANRRSGRVPSLAEYPARRRAANGIFMFDLPEPILRAEIPQELARRPVWRILPTAVNDLLAWCNDIASYAKEEANGDGHNYVHLAAQQLGLAPAEAMRWVTERIIERAADLRLAIAALPAEFDSLGLDRATARNVSKVACGFAAMPRAHLEWLLTTRRYRNRIALTAPQPGR